MRWLTLICGCVLIASACAGAPPTGPGSATATATASPTTVSQSMSPSAPTASPSNVAITPPMPLANGSIVDLPDAVLDAAIALWTHGDEVAIETPTEVVVVSGETLGETERIALPDVAQINGLLLTEDSLWVIDHDNGQFLRVDRSSGEVVADVDVPRGNAVSLLDTPDGIWGGWAHAIPAGVELIDPATNEVVRQIEEGAFPAFGLDSLWFSRNHADVAVNIRRVDPTSGAVLSTIPSSGAQICYIGGLFPDAVWSWCFLPDIPTEAARIDIEGGQIVARVPLNGEGGLSGVIGGASWFTVESSAGTMNLVAIDNDTNQITDEVEVAPGSLFVVAAERSWLLDRATGLLWTFEQS